jgi:hypothetical protein
VLYKGLHQKLAHPVKGNYLPCLPNLVFLTFLGRTSQDPQNPVSSGGWLSCFSKNLSAFYKSKSVSVNNRTTFFMFMPSPEKTSLTFRVSRLLLLRSHLKLTIPVYFRNVTTYFWEVDTYILKNTSNFWRLRLAFLKFRPKPWRAHSLPEVYDMLFRGLHQHLQKPVGFFKCYAIQLREHAVLTKISSGFLRIKPQRSECMSRFLKVHPAFYNLCRTLLNVCRTSFRLSHG